MLQLIQNYKTGKMEIVDVPIPNCGTNYILVRNVYSLVSIGTERSIIDLAKKSLLGKARSRPDLVKRFLDKAKKEGLLKTFQEALGRLDNPVPLGYSSAGLVIETGKNVHKFSPGDRVACIGAGYASHAEYITVPENLCVKIPDGVEFEEASFGMLGIIAMHGIRCANLTFGEKAAVIGLGLLGLITIQILKAYGCNVIGFDIDREKVELAKKLGINFATNDINEFKNFNERFSEGYGTDAVIITTATKSNQPINLAVDISRFRGKIVVVGVADIHPNRNEMWHKEVEIIVSKAGGPGSLDSVYENNGIDYPIGYIRWTENRNLSEFLRLISEKKIDVKSLITHKININDSIKLYENILNNKGGPYIGVLINYEKNEKLIQEDLSEEENISNVNVLNENDEELINKNFSKNLLIQKPIIGIIGAGLFGKALLIPALSRIDGKELHSICTSNGINANHVAKKYKIKNITTNYKDIINNPEINSLVIITPHSQHAKMILDGLENRKHIFVEKPLCVNYEELNEILKLYKNIKNKPFLMVGYNRRFSPHSVKVKKMLINRKDPIMINYRINAGFVPSDHWVHSEKEGGSRVIGEICHFVDLIIYFTGSKPYKIYAERVSGNNKTIVNDDNISIIIKFSDSSIGNIFYSASGDKAFSREYIEIYSEGKTYVIKDFKESQFWLGGKKINFKTFNQEMGYKEELKHFLDVITGKDKPKLTFDEIFYSTLAVFKINESISKGKGIII